MFKGYHKNTRTTLLTTFWFFIVNFDEIWYRFLVFLLLILNKYCISLLKVSKYIFIQNWSAILGSRLSNALCSAQFKMLHLVIIRRNLGKSCIDILILYKGTTTCFFNSLKINNENIEAICEICSKLTINASECHHLRFSDVLRGYRRGIFWYFNFEQIQHIHWVFQF